MATAGDTENNNLPTTGRVVRLHFSCRAELPIGSFLRVTGSSLWAPGSSTLVESDAATATVNAGVGAVAPPGHHGASQGATTAGGSGVAAAAAAAAPPNGNPTSLDDEHDNDAHLYSSSVEMVTTPDAYPVWTTRTPVVVILHQHHKNVHQHHYYRYLVTSPGGLDPHQVIMNATAAGGGANVDDDDDEEDDDDIMDDIVAATSSEYDAFNWVLAFEDPFGVLPSSSSHAAAIAGQQGNNNNRAPAPRSTSAVSLASSSFVQHHATATDYRNLPYRSIDIDIRTGKLVPPAGMDGDDEDEEYVVRDDWNNGKDPTFQPYLIREAIHKENRLKLQHAQRLPTVASTDGNDGDGNVASLPSSGRATPPTFSSNPRIFFVCFHLPVVVVQNQATGQWRASWSESILAKTEGSQILSTYDATWVGTVTTHPPLQNDADKQAVRKILQEMNCRPIFLEPATRQAHYYGFCKQVLWPAFHNIDLLDLSTCGWLSDPNSGTSDWDQSRLDDWYAAYEFVNQAFCDELSDLVRPNDIVWIHDYHLSLLPQQLSTFETKTFGRSMTRKVFFLHIPFPTSQIFRELECGENILQGMLHANVVGFHAFDHARHFLNAAKRILGLNYESLAGGLIGVNFHNSTVLVSMSNVSIEPRMADAALMLPSVRHGRDDLKNKHQDRYIIGGVDMGQRLSGVSLKLLAYERFLHDYPVWKDKVVMIQRVLLPGSRKMDEAVTTRELRALVERIKENYGEAVIDYEEVTGSGLPMDKRLALWQATDVLMSTPIREGLNHWPMEYIYAHKEPEKPGVVIASEFSAISSILNGAVRVNPFDIQMTVTTIEKALNMTEQEREDRRYRDIDFVSSSPSDKWVRNVLRDLRDATVRQNTGGSESNSQASTPRGSMTPLRKELIDSTAVFLARENSLAFTQLNFNALRRAYENTSNRVIITDFNGTIVLKEPPGKYLKREILGTSGNKPPEEVIDALAVLSEDPNNTVYVVSGDSSENVMAALGDVPTLGLAVSNGARFSPPAEEEGMDREWLTFDLGVDWDAVKRVALPVLSKYTARTNGAFVKLTAFSICWSYYSCDPEWGSLQAAHLVIELENELHAFDVRFVTLKGMVEIVPRKLNKGIVVKKVLRDTSLQSDCCVDFVLCLGDDISDEKMFTAVLSFFAELGDEQNSKQGPSTRYDDGAMEDAMDTTGKVQISDNLYCFTVAVGKKASHASCYVNDAQAVANALVMLATGDIPEGGVPVWGREHRPSLFR